MDDDHAPALAAALALLATGRLRPINLSLAQIDASRLLLTQTVRLYVSVTDEDGQPVAGLQEASASRSPPTASISRPRRSRLQRGPRRGRRGHRLPAADRQLGEHVRHVAGRPTTDAAACASRRRREAVRTFLSSMTNPADRVGLVAYNTLYHRSRRRARQGARRRPARRDHAAAARRGLHRAVRQHRPSGDRRFAGASAAARRSSCSPTARTSPMQSTRASSHPGAGGPHRRLAEPIRACQEEGVSVYAISFGAEKDRNLQRSRCETGGRIFDAAEPRGAAGRLPPHPQRRSPASTSLSYRAGMAPAERTFVRVR